MKVSYYRLLYNSFIRIKGPAISSAGLILAILPFYVMPESVIPSFRVGWLVFPSIIAIVMFWVLIDASYQALLQKPPLPKVITSYPPPPSYGTAKALLLIEPHDAFSHGSAVAIYHLSNDLEIFLGLGEVVNIQEDGKVQVVATAVDGNAHEEEWKRILERDANKLGSLRLKTHIRAEYLGGPRA